MDTLIVVLLVGIMFSLSMILKKLDSTKSEISKELKNLNDALKNNH